MGERHDADGRALTALPAVHELAAALDAPRALAVAAARRAIAEERDHILAGQPASQRLLDRAGQIAAELQRPSLRRVLNATGVIVHTNLGRAPLPAAARDAVAATADGYSNLELDLDTGEPQSANATFEFRNGQIRVLHRQGAKADEASRVSAHDLRNVIVQQSGEVERVPGLGPVAEHNGDGG